MFYSQSKQQARIQMCTSGTAVQLNPEEQRAKASSQATFKCHNALQNRSEPETRLLPSRFNSYFDGVGAYKTKAAKEISQLY